MTLYHWHSDEVYGYPAATLGVIAKRDVEGAPDYHAGALEELKAKQNRMIMWLEAVIDEMTPVQQARIADKLGIKAASDAD